jgi:hypothetical protein
MLAGRSENTSFVQRRSNPKALFLSSLHRMSAEYRQKPSANAKVGSQ